LAAVTTRTSACTVRVSTVEVAGVPAALHDRRIFAGEDGLLGNGFLSRFGAVILDDRSGRLLLGGMPAH
jgi:hypothetical protein